MWNLESLDFLFFSNLFFVLLNSLCIAGSPEEAKVQLEKFRNVGIDLPIIQFNPIGNTIESFSLLKKTLLDEA